MCRSEDALTLFGGGYNCAQAVLTAFAPDFDLDQSISLRISGAFGGGLARRGETCGAVTGALMVLGLKYGKVRADDNAARERCFSAASDLMARFEAAHGSTACRELIGFDQSTPEGLQAAREAAVFVNLCPAFVRSAVEIASTLIDDGESQGC